MLARHPLLRGEALAAPLVLLPARMVLEATHVGACTGTGHPPLGAFPHPALFCFPHTLCNTSSSACARALGTSTFTPAASLACPLSSHLQEFISLRQAHDQLLIESTDIGRRVSLLDQASPHMSGPQIMSRMRRASLQRRSTMSEAVHAALASVDMPVSGSALSSGDMGSGGPSMPRIPRHVSAGSAASNGLHPHALSGSLSSKGSRAVPRSSSEPVASLTSGARPAGSQLVHRAVSGASGSTAPSAAQPGGTSAGVAAGSSGGSIGSASNSPPTVAHMPRSPFESDDATVRLRPGGRTSLQRITDDSEAEVEGGDVEHQGQVSGQASLGPARWDELAQPLPLVQRADAAQFYAVLIVDEAIEEFTHA